MKQQIFAASFVVLMTMTASSQQKKEPPPPPKPPKPPVEMNKEVPPPPPPVPPVPPPPAMTEEQPAELPRDYQEFMTRNPSVSAVHWGNKSVVIERKNGKEEKYILNEVGIRQAQAKYGKLPTAPPPPPKAPKPPVLMNR